jgi:hypothetical protein
MGPVFTSDALCEVEIGRGQPRDMFDRDAIAVIEVDDTICPHRLNCHAREVLQKAKEHFIGYVLQRAFRDGREAKAIQLDGVLTFAEVVDDVRSVVAAEDKRIRAADGGAVRVPEVAPHTICGVCAAHETVIPALGAVFHEPGIAGEIVLSRIRPTREGVVSAFGGGHVKGIADEVIENGVRSTPEMIVAARGGGHVMGITIEAVRESVRPSREGVVPTRGGGHEPGIAVEIVEAGIRPAREGVVPTRGERHVKGIATENVPERVRSACEVIVTTYGAGHVIGIAVEFVADTRAYSACEGVVATRGGGHVMGIAVEEVVNSVRPAREIVVSTFGIVIHAICIAVEEVVIGVRSTGEMIVAALGAARHDAGIAEEAVDNRNKLSRDGQAPAREGVVPAPGGRIGRGHRPVGIAVDLVRLVVYPIQGRRRVVSKISNDVCHSLILAV